MLVKLKVFGLLGMLLFAAICFVMPMQVAQGCDAWPGGGLDDGPYQALYSTNAPLQGKGQIDRAAARALNEAWAAAGRPDNFDASPYLKAGPDCDGPSSTTEANNSNDND
jgi:hypothetical protein